MNAEEETPPAATEDDEILGIEKSIVTPSNSAFRRLDDVDQDLHKTYVIALFIYHLCI